MKTKRKPDKEKIIGITIEKIGLPCSRNRVIAHSERKNVALVNPIKSILNKRKYLVHPKYPPIIELV